MLEYEPHGKAAREVRSVFEWLENKLIINPLLEDLKNEVSVDG